MDEVSLWLISHLLMFQIMSLGFLEILKIQNFGIFPGSGFDQIPASGLISSSVDKSLLWCFRRWSLRFPFCVDLCLQRRHGKGFADTWIRKWISRRLPAWNSLKQTLKQFKSVILPYYQRLLILSVTQLTIKWRKIYFFRTKRQMKFRNFFETKCSINLEFLNVIFFKTQHF